MTYFKIFCYLIFVIFNFFIINNYFSKNFLTHKKIARENYKSYLNKEIKKIKTIPSKKNFKKFKDNSKYYQKDEEKQFWKLLKTK
tara:strand:+ start:7901 stop:8155 length:255 start_codon:yes stop_codon:yes gene_type:complete